MTVGTRCAILLDMSKTHWLSAEQIEALEGMIARRMGNTGETREEACRHLAQFFRERFSLDTGRAAG